MKTRNKALWNLTVKDVAKVYLAYRAYKWITGVQSGIANRWAEEHYDEVIEKIDKSADRVRGYMKVRFPIEADKIQPSEKESDKPEAS